MIHFPDDVTDENNANGGVTVNGQKKKVGKAKKGETKLLQVTTNVSCQGLKENPQFLNEKTGL